MAAVSAAVDSFKVTGLKREWQPSPRVIRGTLFDAFPTARSTVRLTHILVPHSSHSYTAISCMIIFLKHATNWVAVKELSVNYPFLDM